MADKIGGLQALGLAITAPVKGAASAGLLVGALANAAWDSREFIEKTANTFVRGTTLAAAAGSKMGFDNFLSKSAMEEPDADKAIAKVMKYWTK